jgi:hypothetical protein
MRHELCDSLHELIAPETLTVLTGEPIASVCRQPFVGGHSASGSRFVALETNGGRGPRLVVKQTSPEWDWIARATADERGREAVVWAMGLLDRLPPEIVHPVVACAHDGAGWAILMRDVSAALIPESIWTSGERISRADHRRYLDAFAALHATFWRETPATPDLEDALCSPPHLYTSLSPETGRIEANHPNPVVREIREGWELFWPLVEPDVAVLLQGLLRDPAPLCNALARYPQTLVHGDLRSANLGMLRTGRTRPRVVLLDWHFVGRSVPATDLAWYLALFGPLMPETKHASIAWYRECLHRRLGNDFDHTWWQPQLELSLLGLLVRMGWSFGCLLTLPEYAGYHTWAREELAWWSAQARTGARWL